MWEELFANEVARGIIAPAIMALLAIPQGAIGQVLKILPDSIFPPENIPFVLAAVGLIGGYLIGYYTPVPMDLAMTIGTGSGLGAKAFHDHSASKKTAKAMSGVWKPKGKKDA